MIWSGTTRCKLELLAEAAHSADEMMNATPRRGQTLAARARRWQDAVLCRGRKATLTPSRVPTTMLSLGSPKGVLWRTSSSSLRPSMS
jgi:hypothetical protein